MKKICTLSTLALCTMLTICAAPNKIEKLQKQQPKNLEKKVYAILLATKGVLFSGMSVYVACYTYDAYADSPADQCESVDQFLRKNLGPIAILGGIMVSASDLKEAKSLWDSANKKQQ